MSVDILIVILSVLILIGYIFEFAYKKIRIPSILVLILMGIVIQWIVKNYLQIKALPDLQTLLKLLGTIGLVLIVLEGTLELKIRKDNYSFVSKTFLFSLFEVIIITILCSAYIVYFKKFTWHQALLNIIPFSIISSSIAIPTAAVLSKQNKSFIVYESSFSDILGVLFFNFFLLNENITLSAIANFSFEIIILLLLSVLASIILALLLNHLKHKIKFLPVIVLMLFFYSLLHYYHLPSLLFIMIFGLLLSNFDLIRESRWIKFLRLHTLNREIYQLDEIISELTFVVKSLFFLILGFSLNISNLFDMQAFSWAVGILVIALFTRILLIKIFKFTFREILFIFPRGLITILLFYLIPSHLRLIYFNDTVLTHIIFISVILLILNNLIFKTKIELTEI